jgi:hypothetical protein
MIMQIVEISQYEDPQIRRESKSHPQGLRLQMGVKELSPILRNSKVAYKHHSLLLSAAQLIHISVIMVKIFGDSVKNFIFPGDPAPRIVNLYF